MSDDTHQTAPPSHGPTLSGYYGLHLELRDEGPALEAYTRHHAHPFEEVIAALREAGAQQMHIWGYGRRLFMSYRVDETRAPGGDLSPYLKAHPRCQEWEDLMGTLQALPPDADPSRKWQPMSLLFDFDAHGRPGREG